MVKLAVFPTMGKARNQEFIPPWLAGHPGLPARITHSQSPARPSRRHSRQQWEGAETEEGESGEADVRIAEGNRNKNRRGKKQGSRLLYNSWLIKDAQGLGLCTGS